MASPMALLMAVLIGAGLMVAAAYARLWQGVGARPHHPLMTLYALSCSLVCGLRIAQMATENPVTGMVIGHIFGTVGFSLGVVWVAVIRCMGGQKVITPWFMVYTGILLFFAVAVWVPGFIFEAEPLQRPDAFRVLYWGSQSGPWVMLLVLGGITTSIGILAAAWTYPRDRQPERTTLLVSSVAASVLIQTNYLSLSIAPWIPPVGVLALPLLVLPAAVMLAQHMDKLATQLDSRVRERTQDLHDRNTQLEEAVQRAEEARRAQVRFLANVSHELRTPLTGVLGVLNLVRDRNADDAPQLLRVARRSGQELLELINELLDAARIDANMVVLEEQPVVLRSLLRDLINAHRPQATAKSLSLRHDVQRDVPLAVRVDPTRLRQILHNLIGNALKFTETGGVELCVTRTEDRLHFLVTDTGPGLGSNLSTIFERFTQADDSTTRVFGGSGLGLSIARDFALLMQGELSAENAPEQGAVFHLVLPLIEAPPPEGPATPVSNTSRVRFHGQVLLVDDDATNRLVICRMLKAYGVDVLLANDGLQALKLLEASKPDLVLMDCYMPHMDGFEATRALRAREQHRMPVVALTASAGPADRAASLAAGMDHHLSKPIVLPELEQVLARYLRSD